MEIEDKLGLCILLIAFFSLAIAMALRRNKALLLRANLCSMSTTTGALAFLMPSALGTFSENQFIQNTVFGIGIALVLFGMVGFYKLIRSLNEDVADITKS